MNKSETTQSYQQPQSFWLASTRQTDYPKLNEDIRVDVAIIGGGITGITCAWLLKSEGMTVAVIEADRIVQGVTANTTAKITSQHQLIYSKIKQTMSVELAKQYAEANETAIRLISDIVTEHNIDCDFIPQSAYIFTQREGYLQKLVDEAELAKELGIKASFTEDVDLPFKVKGALCYEDQAQFHPRKYLLALAEKIPGDGSHIFEQSRVIDIDDEKQYAVKTDQGHKVLAEKIVMATHYPIYNKAGLYSARIYPDRSYVVAIKAKEPYPGGMYITAEEPGRSLRYQPSEDGELIFVGGEHHKTGQGPDTREHYQALVDFARQNYTVEDIPYRWSTHDCMTLDGVPYVGHFSENTPNFYLATGFGKWGMTNSMVSARIIKDLMLHGQSPWQEVYNPSRKTITASAKTFVVENLNVASQLISGKLTYVPEEVDVERGEAKIVDIDGQKAGVFKDEDGKLHVVDTTCTHLGCELNWNSAERSWDCPCHGSRFTYDGEIIQGPAITPLKKGEELNH
ncbi:FAD-dependent oxidoreductase [Dethiobacter alkaliphilus]|uniref:FAD dependent oxidoreductase n=1 Tax=Dethiobacter alkaliphilus AHT 1 TaxID=555088 RepID=C0GC58_DETAL|nr:FAD-dependent oxidoreductase [Dethiobacter alkaliphilus]EEG78793.1 FAD dependent oxidoreductase [Dethiobacter alkaliphilus AHT 1]